MKTSRGYFIKKIEELGFSSFFHRKYWNLNVEHVSLFEVIVCRSYQNYVSFYLPYFVRKDRLHCNDVCVFPEKLLKLLMYFLETLQYNTKSSGYIYQV
jgi:hypothetical protein